MRVALLLTLLLLCGCSTAPHYRALFIGDSITRGICFPGPCTPFPELVASDHLETVNLGCSGATTRTWLWSGHTPYGWQCLEAFDPITGLWSCWENMVEPEDPGTFVFVLLGTNDARGIDMLPELPSPEQYKANLQILLWRLERKALLTVLLKPYWLPDDPQANARLAEYREILDDLCAENIRVMCGPDLAEVIEAEDFSDIDKVHPNQRGYFKIASAIVEWIHDLRRGKRYGEA